VCVENVKSQKWAKKLLGLHPGKLCGSKDLRGPAGPRPAVQETRTLRYGGPGLRY
jgi:hypothetical protein